MQVRVVGEHGVEVAQEAPTPAVAEKTPGQFIRWTFRVFFWPEVVAVGCWIVLPMIFNGGMSIPAPYGGALFLLWWASLLVLPVLLFIHLVAMISGAALRCLPSSHGYVQGSTPGWRGFVVTVVVIAGVVGGSIGGYQLAYDAKTFRLKATATILVDGVERTGMSVQEYHLETGSRGFDVFNYTWVLKVRGEAVRIDVPGEEPIYVTMYANTVYANCAAGAGDRDAIKDRLLQFTRCVVRVRPYRPGSHPRVYPPTVRFDGSGNYEEAIPVYVGGEDADGYQFVSMTYERTNDPVTEGRIPVELWGYKGSSVKVTSPYWTYKGSVKVPLGERTGSINTHFKLEDF